MNIPMLDESRGGRCTSPRNVKQPSVLDRDPEAAADAKFVEFDWTKTLRGGPVSPRSNTATDPAIALLNATAAHRSPRRTRSKSPSRMESRGTVSSATATSPSAPSIAAHMTKIQHSSRGGFATTMPAMVKPTPTSPRKVGSPRTSSSGVGAAKPQQEKVVFRAVSDGRHGRVSTDTDSITDEYLSPPSESSSVLSPSPYRSVSSTEEMVDVWSMNDVAEVCCVQKTAL
jgi:hypothetical protein